MKGSNLKNEGEYLRQLRVKKGLTLQELADSTNFNISLLSKIERGERSLNLDLVPGLAHAFEIEFKVLQTDLMALKVANEYSDEEFALEGLKKALTQLKG